MNHLLRKRLRAGLTLVLAFGALACDDTDPLPLASAPTDVVEIQAPALRQSDLVRSTFVVDSTSVSDADAPAAASDPTVYPFQGVYSWGSTASIGNDYASLVSKHKYNSNYARIESTLHVTRGDAHAASQDAEIQQYVPAFFQFGLMRDVLLENYLYIDAGCGYKARGNATHSAWWGLYQGRGAPTWGAVTRSSTAYPATGQCSGRRGTRTGTVNEPGGFVCSVLITYDLDTLEVVSMDVISCSTGVGVEL